MLVEFLEPVSLIEHTGIEQDLEDITGKRVDFLTEGSIEPSLREMFTAEIMVLVP